MFKGQLLKEFLERHYWHPFQWRTGPPAILALARWASWSAGQVGRHVKCWLREWNGGEGPGPLAKEEGLYVYSDKLLEGYPSF